MQGRQEIGGRPRTMRGHTTSPRPRRTSPPFSGCASPCLKHCTLTAPPPQTGAPRTPARRPPRPAPCRSPRRCGGGEGGAGRPRRLDHHHATLVGRLSRQLAPPPPPAPEQRLDSQLCHVSARDAAADAAVLGHDPAPGGRLGFEAPRPHDHKVHPTGGRLQQGGAGGAGREQGRRVAPLVTLVPRPPPPHAHTHRHPRAP